MYTLQSVQCYCMRRIKRFFVIEIIHISDIQKFLQIKRIKNANISSNGAGTKSTGMKINYLRFSKTCYGWCILGHSQKYTVMNTIWYFSTIVNAKVKR